MFVSPSDLTDNQFKAIKAIGKHSKPVPFCGGMVYTKDYIFRLSLAQSLSELGLVIIDAEELKLTHSGLGLYRKISQ